MKSCNCLVRIMNEKGSESVLREFRQLFLVIFVLSLVSATSLAYQTWEWLNTGECGCNPAFNQYSTIFGVPVSLIGLMGMLTFAGFALLFIIEKSIFGLEIFLLYKIFFGLLSIGLLFVIYLMYTSYIVVGALCQLCFISQTITIINWLIGLRIFLYLFRR